MALGPTLQIKGDITAGEDVTIAGHVEGRIVATGHAVTLAPGSHIVGEVAAASIQISGRVEGALEASESVRVMPDGDVEGELQTARLAIADGGRVHGRVQAARRTESATDAPQS